MNIKRSAKEVRSNIRKGRLNFVLDEELKEWAHNYARRNHTSLTALITSYLVRLREKENVPNVEQI